MRREVHRAGARGFTLIELLIVVAIFGIAAAIGIPAWQNYTVRSQVERALAVTSPAKSAVLAYYRKHKAFPDTNAQAKLGKPDSITDRYAASVTVGQGGSLQLDIDPAHADNGIRGKTLELTPEVVGGTLRWVCRAPDIHNGYLPSHCRS